MSWVKLDDQFTDHPKVVKAGPMAAWLFVCGLAYCGRFLTDGTIPREQVRRLADIDNPMTHAAKLVSVGLWHETSDGFQVNDYLEYNPAGDKVRLERSAAKERMSRHRSAELPANKMRSSSSPSPFPFLIPREDKDTAHKNEPCTPAPPVESERDTISHEVTPLPKPVKKKTPGEGEEFPPALTLFRSAFQTHKGRFPVRDPSVEGRLQRIFDEQGEETFRRALDGFFSCVGGRDMFPKDQGFPMVVFVRQFDRWEGADQSRIRSSNGSNATGRNGSATHADAKQQSGWAKQIAADLAQRAAQA